MSRKETFIVTVLLILVGTGMHFVHHAPWFNHFWGYIFPVTESVMAHMKMNFYPMLLLSLYLCISRRDIEEFGAPILAGMAVMPLVIAVFFAYWVFIRHELLPLDIVIYTAAMIGAVHLVKRWRNRSFIRKNWPLWIAVAATAMVAIGLLTYKAPNWLIFTDMGKNSTASKEPVKYLALAFDDGPNLTTESKMLDVLAKHEVTATFFVIGNNIDENTARNIVRARDMGCEIANHSLTHSMMSQMDEEQVKAEIEATSEKIEMLTGQRPKLFRPPYINVKPEMYDWIDLTFICGKGCEDWVATVGKEARLEGIIANAEPGAIYLLHDFEGNEATVEALDEAIPVLKEQGYVFVTVSQLFENLKCTPDGHTLYTVVPDGR